LPLLLGNKHFERFLALSYYLYEDLGWTHKIALVKLFSVFFELAANYLDISEAGLIDVLKMDYASSDLQSLPVFLSTTHLVTKKPVGNRKRQLRHLSVIS